MAEENPKTIQPKKEEHTFLYALVFAVIVVLIWGFASNWWQDSTPEDRALEDSTALVFCENLAEDNAEYGWKKSLFDTSFEHEDGNVAVIFRNSRLGNAMGGEQLVDVKCVVSGTDNEPSLVSFDAI